MAIATTGNKSKGKTIKLIIEITFFVSLMVFAIIYILKDDPASTFRLLSEADILPLTIAIGCLLVTILLDGFNIFILARLYNGKYKYYQGVINVCIGQVIGVFVKTGASILQAYTFSKQEVKNAQAASVLTMNYLIFQLSLFFYSSVMILFGYPYVKDVPVNLLGNIPLSLFCILALVVQCLILFVIISLGYWRGFHRFVLNTGIDFLNRLHLLKNPDETRRKLTLQFVTYRIEMKRLTQHKWIVAFILISNILKRFLFGIIPYFLFWALKADMSKLPFLSSLFSTGYVNTISSLVTVGAPEVMFQSTFSYFLGNANGASLASAANLLWRSITFYLLFIIGVISLVFYRGAPKRNQILSNTSTIYDMELENLKMMDDKTLAYLNDIHFHKKQAPLLSKREVNESFKELRKHLSDELPREEDIDSELKSTLEEQRLHLAEIEKEAALEIEKQKPDSEIEMEAEKELRLQQKKYLKRKRKKERKQKIS